MLGCRQLVSLLLITVASLASQAQVGTPVRQAQTAKSTGNLTAAAVASGSCGATSCVTVSTTGYAVATVTVHGTYSGATFQFEFSDDGGTTYYPQFCTETAAAVQETNKTLNSSSLAWDCAVYATTNFEVRQSAISSGTAVVSVTLSAAPIEPALTVSGAGNFNAVLAAETTKLIGEVMPVTTATTTDTSLRCTLVSAASTNATNCKNSSGNVYGFRFVNTTTTLYYLRMYNSSAAPTCSSATGFVESIPIPPAGASGQAGGIVAMEPFGEGYSTGISFCFTGGSGSTDNTNAAAGVFGTILYK